MKLLTKIGCGILLAVTVIACKKDKNTVSGIPLVNVNLQIFTTDPGFINLQVPGGFDYVRGGSRGIIIYRLSNDQFMAYDRHCPYLVEDACQVGVDSTGVTLTDACCSSAFIITDGSVIQGPSSAPLHAYRTDFDGAVLRVFN